MTEWLKDNWMLLNSESKKTENETRTTWYGMSYQFGGGGGKRKTTTVVFEGLQFLFPDFIFCQKPALLKFFYILFRISSTQMLAYYLKLCGEANWMILSWEKKTQNETWPCWRGLPYRFRKKWGVVSEKPRKTILRDWNSCFGIIWFSGKESGLC
jgi:hypothetical protein